MTRPVRRLPAVLLLALLPLLLTSCGLPLPDGVQSAGQVQAGSDEPLQLKVIPPGPQKGAAPEDIVLGFLAAQRSPDEGHAVARKFLAPDVDWDDEQGAVVYTGRRFLEDDDSDPSTFGVRYDAIARVEPTGAYALDDTTVVAEYSVGRMPSGEYRLTSVPPGLHLTTQARERSFTGYDVYFLGRSADGSTTSRLVPDRVFLPVTAKPAPALVAALLRGATPTLRPAVGTAVPPGTELASPVDETDGVVTVDLTSEVAELGSRSLQRLSAQLVWTLLPTYSGVRLLVEGEPVDVEGAPAVQTLADWAGVDPDGRSSDARVYYVADRRLRALSGPLPDSEATAERGLDVDEVAVSPLEGTVALLTRDVDGQDELRTGRLAGPLSDVVLRRPRLDSMSFGAGDQGLWALAPGDRPAVCLIPLQSAGAQDDFCDVPYEQPDGAGPLSALRVSRDGARVALVFGTGDDRRLHVGRVEPSNGGWRIAGVGPVAPMLAGVTDVAWESGTSLAVLASSPGAAQVVVWRVAVDGSTGPEAVQRPGLPGDAVALAASAGKPLVVGALLDGVPRLYRDDGTLFRLEASPGTAPAYPG